MRSTPPLIPQAEDGHLLEAMRQRAIQEPQAPAVRLLVGDKDHALSRQELMRGAMRWARALEAASLLPGSIVLIFLAHHPRQYEVFLGAMAAGLVPSFMPPINAKQSPEVYWPAHRELIELTVPGAIICDMANAVDMHRLLDLNDMLLLTPDKVEATELPEMPSQPFRCDHNEAIAFLQHSSGTTRTKKGVALSHHAVAAQIRAYQHRLALSTDEYIVSWLPLYHDMGLIACCIMPLVLGIPLLAIDALIWTARPGLLLEMISQVGGTLV
jgi:acyl-CoA synthetase (AMP-forming)/AMP-acid ligase II